MEWWDSFVAWLFSNDVARVFNTAVFPTLAILVAGIIGALIGRGSTKRVVSLYERDQRMSAVLAAIDSARRAARWNLLSNADQHHADTLALEADVRLRLLPAPGASLAADWVTHEIGQMKRDSVSFSFQAEQTLIEVRNRMLQWHERPARAKKLFKNDLDAWAYEATLQEESLVAQQQAWAAEQANGARAQAQDAPAPEAQAPDAPAADAVESATAAHPAVPPSAAPPASATAASPPTAPPAAASPAPPPPVTSPTSPAPSAPPAPSPNEAAPATITAAAAPGETQQPHDRPVPASAVRERIQQSADSAAQSAD